MTQLRRKKIESRIMLWNKRDWNRINKTLSTRGRLHTEPSTSIEASVNSLNFPLSQTPDFDNDTQG
jgi:hypothetical protein